MNLRSRQGRRGFTLIELMLALAIVGVLGALASRQVSAQMALAKRSEALVGLDLLWQAQQAYFAENNRFADTFDELSFQISGGRALSPTTYQGQRYKYQLSQPWGPDSFYCVATGNLDSDVYPDVLELFERP